MKISKFKAIFITTLCLLTFMVIIYDIQILNEKVLWIRVWGYSQEYSESWKTVVDITNHTLKEAIMRYVNQSIQAGVVKYGQIRRETIYVINHPEMEYFFGQYSFSSWCGTCMLYESAHFKDGDTYYHVMVSHSKVPPTLIESGIAGTVSIVTIALWICTVFLYEITNSKSASLGVYLIALGFLFLYAGLTQFPYIGSIQQIFLALAVLSVIIGIILISWNVFKKQEANKTAKKEDAEKL
jgi:hypothetical protein